MAKRGSEGPSGLQSGAISRRLVGDGAISMLYNTKNSLMQCWRRPVTRITTLAPARAFSVNGLQDLDFLTASQGAIFQYVTVIPNTSTKKGQRGSIEEGDFLHRVTLAVSRPQLRSFPHRAGGDRRIGYLDSMAPPVLPQVLARLMARFFVDRSACQRPEEIV